MPGERRNTEALGGVVAGREIGYTGFAREMHRLFGNLATHVGVEPERDCLLETALGAAGTPADAGNRARGVADQQRRTPECGGERGLHASGVRGGFRASVPGDVLLAEAPFRDPFQSGGELRVVAKFRMRIEREVIGEEVDVVRQQGTDAAAADTGDAPILALPEPAVMDEQRIGTARDGGVDQCLAGGNAGNDALHGSASFHLQTVWAIIPEARRFQRCVQVALQFITFHAEFHSLDMKRLWLIFAQTVTIGLAVYFVISTLKPAWLAGSAPAAGVVQILQSSGSEAAKAAASYSGAAQRVIPSVVHIYTTQTPKQPRHPLMDDPVFRHFFGERFGDGRPRSSGLGSGVIVSGDGYVLTNYHVVEAADAIEVALNDGRKLKAVPVGADPETDLAVLRISPAAGQDARFSPITLGRMEDVRVGDVVLAIGNPFGVGQSVTMGIVSALGRTQLGINTFEDFIQTDAAINPGNSGGALTDAAGNLIGINTAIYSRSGGSLGIGFAIPVSTAKSVMEQIIQSGSVTRGWIGVEAQEITAEIAESFGLPGTDGALIAGVVRGSPADNGGIRPGDILLAVSGKPVRDPQVMLDLIASLKPGETAAFKLRREKAIVDAQVKIGKRPPVVRGGRE